MNILIVGCGKVGSMLASELDRMGHDVAVLDREEAHFTLLDSDFQAIPSAVYPSTRMCSSAPALRVATPFWP